MYKPINRLLLCPPDMNVLTDLLDGDLLSVPLSKTVRFIESLIQTNQLSENKQAETECLLVQKTLSKISCNQRVGKITTILKKYYSQNIDQTPNNPIINQLADILLKSIQDRKVCKTSMLDIFLLFGFKNEIIRTTLMPLVLPELARCIISNKVSYTDHPIDIILKEIDTVDLLNTLHENVKQFDELAKDNMLCVLIEGICVMAVNKSDISIQKYEDAIRWLYNHGTKSRYIVLKTIRYMSEQIIKQLIGEEIPSSRSIFSTIDYTANPLIKMHNEYISICWSFGNINITDLLNIRTIDCLQISDLIVRQLESHDNKLENVQIEQLFDHLHISTTNIAQILTHEDADKFDRMEERLISILDCLLNRYHDQIDPNRVVDQIATLYQSYLRQYNDPKCGDQKIYCTNIARIFYKYYPQIFTQYVRNIKFTPLENMLFGHKYEYDPTNSMNDRTISYHGWLFENNIIDDPLISQHLVKHTADPMVPKENSDGTDQCLICMNNTEWMVKKCSHPLCVTCFVTYMVNYVVKEKWHLEYDDVLIANIYLNNNNACCKCSYISKNQSIHAIGNPPVGDPLAGNLPDPVENLINMINEWIDRADPNEPYDPDPDPDPDVAKFQDILKKIKKQKAVPKKMEYLDKDSESDSDDDLVEQPKLIKRHSVPKKMESDDDPPKLIKQHNVPKKMESDDDQPKLIKRHCVPKKMESDDDQPKPIKPKKYMGNSEAIRASDRPRKAPEYYGKRTYY